MAASSFRMIQYLFLLKRSHVQVPRCGTGFCSRNFFKSPCDCLIYLQQRVRSDEEAVMVSASTEGRRT